MSLLLNNDIQAGMTFRHKKEGYLVTVIASNSRDVSFRRVESPFAGGRNNLRRKKTHYFRYEFVNAATDSTSVLTLTRGGELVVNIPLTGSLADVVNVVRDVLQLHVTSLT